MLERGLDAVAVALLVLRLAPATLAPMLARLIPPNAALGAAVGPAFSGAALMALIPLLLRRRVTALPWWQARLEKARSRLCPTAWRSLLPATLAATAVSLLIWSSEPMILWLLIQALSPRSLPMGAAVATYLISGSAGMASSLPAGIGVNEATTVLLLSQQGIPVGPALSIAILRRLLTPWSIVALAVALGGVRRRHPKL